MVGSSRISSSGSLISARQRQPALHPAGQRANAGTALAREAGEVEEPRNALVEDGEVDAKIAAIDPQVLDDGEIGIEGVHVRDDADAEPRLARRPGHRLADHLDRSTIGFDQAEAAAQRSRLAGAVRAEQAETLAAANGKRQAPDDFLIAVTLAQPFDTQDDVGRARAGGTRGCRRRYRDRVVHSAVKPVAFTIGPHLA